MKPHASIEERDKIKGRRKVSKDEKLRMSGG